MMFSQYLNNHRILKRLAKALIRLHVCAGWSEALLVAHTTLLEISCHSSNIEFGAHVCSRSALQKIQDVWIKIILQCVSVVFSDHSHLLFPWSCILKCQHLLAFSNIWPGYTYDIVSSSMHKIIYQICLYVLKWASNQTRFYNLGAIGQSKGGTSISTHC